MTDTPASLSQRRPYSKPTLTLVELVTNEAVFRNCKLSSSSSGPDNVSGSCREWTNYPNTQRCREYLS